MKSKSLFWVFPFWFCVALIYIFASCSGDNDYYYPSVKQEFVTAHSAADGSLQTLVTDEGDTFSILEDASHTKIQADSTVRLVCLYGKEEDTGTQGVKLYSLLKAIAPVPQPAAEFSDGVKADPVDILSLWMGLDYLNMILEIKAQNGTHLFHFVQNEVLTYPDSGERIVRLSLYHDAGNDVEAYTKRAYASIPLRQYVEEGITNIIIYFSVYTYSGITKTYQFAYQPKMN